MDKNITQLTKEIISNCNKKKSCKICKSKSNCNRFFPEWLRPSNASADLVHSYIKKYYALHSESIEIANKGNYNC